MDDSAIASVIDKLLSEDRYGAVAEEDIAAAERELGLRFPRSYRVFLHHFGAANCKYEIYGLPNTRNTDRIQPKWYHVVDATKMMAAASRDEEFHKHLICIMANGGGVKFYIDTSVTDADGESPVVAWGPDSPGDVVGATFVEFLQNIRSPENDPT